MSRVNFLVYSEGNPIGYSEQGSIEMSMNVNTISTKTNSYLNIKSGRRNGVVKVKGMYDVTSSYNLNYLLGLMDGQETVTLRFGNDDWYRQGDAILKNWKTWADNNDVTRYDATFELSGELSSQLRFVVDDDTGFYVVSDDGDYITE